MKKLSSTKNTVWGDGDNPFNYLTLNKLYVNLYMQMRGEIK